MVRTVVYRFLFVNSILSIDSVEDKSLQKQTKNAVGGERRTVLIYLDP